MVSSFEVAPRFCLDSVATVGMETINPLPQDLSVATLTMYTYSLQLMKAFVVKTSYNWHCSVCVSLKNQVPIAGNQVLHWCIMLNRMETFDATIYFQANVLRTSGLVCYMYTYRYCN